MQPDLFEIIQTTAHQVAKAMLIEMGYYSEHITRQEMIKILGVRGFKKAVEKGEINIIKNGPKNSKVTAMRTEFEKYLNKLKYGQERVLFVETTTSDKSKRGGAPCTTR